MDERHFRKDPQGPDGGGEADAPDLNIRVFGRFDVRVGGRSLLPFRTRTEAGLLALLALNHSRPLRREWIAEQLWPESDHADVWLMEALCRVRRQLGSHSRRVRNCPFSSLQLDVSGAQLDLAAFDRAVAEGTRPGLERAVSLYGGPLLEEFSDDWALSERLLREEQYLGTVERLAQLRLEEGSPREAVVLLLSASAVDPIRESLHVLLMDAHAAAGDHAAALRVYHALRRRLMGQNLPVPADITEAAARIRKDARRVQSRRTPVPSEMPARRDCGISPEGDLPHPLTPMIGRNDDLRATVRCITKNRLVTLTGQGGVGKTRLAIAVAAFLADDRGHRPAMVRLEGLPAGGDVARAAASAVGIPGDTQRSLEEALAVRLRQQDALLLLDNCEHVLAQCARFTADLLSRCPRLKVLCTSRRPLGIPGECVRRVMPLPHPKASEADIDKGLSPTAVQRYPAVRLFVERGRSAEASFCLNADNAPLVAGICERLEGLPLGLELASARLRTRTLSSLAAMIDAGVPEPDAGPAVPQRQRSLDASVGWSYALLSGHERAVLERTSVFAGSFSAEAAAAVSEVDSDSAQRVLASLAEQSLLTLLPTGREARYRMHQVVRQYAQTRLGADAERRARDHHLRYYRGLAEEAALRLHSGSERVWLDRLASDHDNLRAAWSHGLKHAELLDECLALGAALLGFWEARGLAVEGKAFYEQAVSVARAAGSSVQAARALCGAAVAGMAQGDSRGRAYLDESCSLFRQAGALRDLSTALRNAVRIAEAQGDLMAAHAYADESVAVSREIGDRHGEADAISLQVRLADTQRKYSLAARLARQAIAIYRELDDSHAEARQTAFLGRILVSRSLRREGLGLMDRGMMQLRRLDARRALAVWLNIRGDLARKRLELDAAAGCYEEGLAIFRAERNLRGAAWALTNLGIVARIQKRLSESSRLIREALRIRFELQDLKGIAEALDALADLALTEAEGSGPAPAHRARRAAFLYGAADKVRAMIETPLTGARRKEMLRQRKALRSLMGLRALRRDLSQGAEMTLTEAVAYALDPELQPSDAGPAPTKRQPAGSVSVH